MNNNNSVINFKLSPKSLVLESSVRPSLACYHYTMAMQSVLGLTEDSRTSDYGRPTAGEPAFKMKI